LKNTELRNFYALPNITRVIKSGRIRYTGHVAHMGEMRNAYKILVENPEVKTPLGIPRRRWEDNIRMVIREIRSRVWTGFMWLRTGTSGGLLCTR
jgi:hypothetical protein